MSASEKLKRLSFWQWRKVIREVVAVVEAAEDEMRMMVKPPRGKFPTDDALRDALAALEEVMS